MVMEPDLEMKVSPVHGAFPLVLYTYSDTLRLRVHSSRGPLKCSSDEHIISTLKKI